eukprot:TRINITY_DN307_c0_g1_i3.p1 TRINITY_DN307_c0_g1~~TRINITY_DN307_c0_g1_i3.p1  ORF type:complete len:371 (-),score=68.24 TRINITY_DN307_c0_g1_i3:255-1367(-)
MSFGGEYVFKDGKGLNINKLKRRWYKSGKSEGNMQRFTALKGGHKLNMWVEFNEPFGIEQCCLVAIFPLYFVYDLCDMGLQICENPKQKEYWSWPYERKKVESEAQDVDLYTPLPWGPLKIDTKEFMVTVDKAGGWSKKFNGNAFGTTNRMSGLFAEIDGSMRELEIGLQIQTAPTPFIRTTSLVFSPRIILVNNLEEPVLFRQFSESKQAYKPVRLEPGNTKPYHWITSKRGEIVKRKYLQVKRDEDNWNWSSLFDANSVGEFPIRFHQRTGRLKELISFQITSKGATVFISVNPGDHLHPPFRVENRMLINSFRFTQQFINIWTDAQPLQTITFSWDDHLREKKLLQSTSKGNKPYTLKWTRLERFGE